MKKRLLATTAGIMMMLAAIPGYTAEGRQPGQVVEPISVIAPDWPEMIELLRLLRPSWEKLGFTFEVQHMTLTSLSARTTGDHNAPQMTVNGYGGAPDRIDPDFFLTELFHSSRAVKGASNYGNYINPDYDRVVDAQRTEMDPEKRKELVDEAQSILVKDQPGMVLYYNDYIQAYREDRLEGVVPVMGNGISLPYIPWTYYTATPTGPRDFIRTTTQYDIATLNPFATGEVQNASLLRWMYAPFAIRNKDLEIEPWAAESWNVVDETTVDVVIRSGMTFNDGKPVTVEDVKFTFDYMEKWKFPSYKRFSDNIAGVEIVDEKTVRFTLKQPYAPFVPNILGYAFIVPKHIWENVTENPTDFANDEAVGYGPFKLGGWEKDQYLHMATKKEWWAAPKTSGVYWLVVPSIDSQLGMLETGESDIMGWGITPSQVKRLPEGIIAERAPSHAPREVRFNLDLAPFDDVAVRRAISMATDRESVVATLSDGAATPGNDAYISPKLSWSNKDIAMPKFDIEKARQILSDAGYTWDGQGRIQYPAE